MKQNTLLSVIGGLIMVMLTIIGFFCEETYKKFDNVVEQTSKNHTDIQVLQTNYVNLQNDFDTHESDDKSIHQTIWDKINCTNGRLQNGNK